MTQPETRTMTDGYNAVAREQEIAALKATLAERNAELHVAIAQAQEWRAESTTAQAEAAALRAEVEALRAAALDALAGWRYIRQQHGDLYGVGWDRVENALSVALATEAQREQAQKKRRLAEAEGAQQNETDGAEALWGARQDVLREALERSRTGWLNVLELDLLPYRHREGARQMADVCTAALNANDGGGGGASGDLAL